jgi:hypothetical protein
MNRPLETGAPTKNCRQCGKPFTAADLAEPYNFKRQINCGIACYNASKKWTPEKAAQVFWSKVEKTDGCWLFNGGRDKWGYGDIQFRRRHIQAHRLAWILTYGEPGELDVLHKCNTPPCCNPDHLYLGDDTDNARDRKRVGSYNFVHSLDQVKAVKRLLATEPMTYGWSRRIADQVGIDPKTVSRIKRGVNWKRLP